MLRFQLGLLFFLLLRLPSFGQELKSVKVFTQAELQQAAQLVNYPVKYLRRATYYPDGSVASLFYYKGTSNRRHIRTARSYGFFPTGKLESRSYRHWLHFRLRRTERWNEAGQLVEIYRRNHCASTSYTYVSRSFDYDQNRRVSMELEKAETGCFSGRILKRKVVAFTPQGRVITFLPLTVGLGDSTVARP